MPDSPDKSPDADGFIRRWLILEPLAADGLTESAVQAAVRKEYLSGQFTAVPGDGDKVNVGGAQLTWHALDTMNYNVNLFHFARAAIINGGGATDFCARFLDAEDRPLKEINVSLGSARSTRALADPDPNFYIFLCFGQSNMEGGGQIEEQERVVDPRFQVLADFDIPSRGWKKGQWYTAVPPLTRRTRGISLVDYFGRTMVANLPERIRVGVVKVGVSATKIELWDKDGYREYLATADPWKVNITNEYGGNPYAYLVDLAKIAQKDGVIKGILLHQGESNADDKDWPRKVKVVYDNLMRDLNLKPESVPLLAGEVVGADQGGEKAGANEIIKRLPETLPNSYVISSVGLPCNAD